MKSTFGLRTLRCGRMRSIFVVVVSFVLIAGCSNSKPASSAAHKTSDTQTGLSTISLLNLDGQPFDLWQNKKAVATVVVFTRTDCPIANRCAPEICRLRALYQPRGVEFFLIYVDPREKPDAIRGHLQEYGYRCQGLRDPKHTLVAHCKATVTPEAVVFNNDQAITYLGRINDLYAELGSRQTEPTSNDLADAIESTINGRPVAVARTKALGCLIADLAD